MALDSSKRGLSVSTASFAASDEAAVMLQKELAAERLRLEKEYFSQVAARRQEKMDAVQAATMERNRHREQVALEGAKRVTVELRHRDKAFEAESKARVRVAEERRRAVEAEEDRKTRLLAEEVLERQALAAERRAEHDQSLVKQQELIKKQTQRKLNEAAAIKQMNEAEKKAYFVERNRALDTASGHKACAVQDALKKRAQAKAKLAQETERKALEAAAKKRKDLDSKAVAAQQRNQHKREQFEQKRMEAMQAHAQQQAQKILGKLYKRVGQEPPISLMTSSSSSSSSGGKNVAPDGSPRTPSRPSPRAQPARSTPSPRATASPLTTPRKVGMRI